MLEELIRLKGTLSIKIRLSVFTFLKQGGVTFDLLHLKNNKTGYNLDATIIHFFPLNMWDCFLVAHLLKYGMYTLNMDTKRNYWLPEYCS